MTEEFISVAIEAFTNANGDVDKFELHLRRKLMSYNMVGTNMQPTQSKSNFESKLENIISSTTPNDDIFKELEGLDINSLNDEQILELAEKLGLMSGASIVEEETITTPEEQTITDE